MIATRAKTKGTPQNQKTMKAQKEKGAEKVFWKQFENDSQQDSQH